MTLKKKVDEDLRAAMKARDARRLSVLRMMKARLAEAEVELRGKKGREHEIDDDDATRALSGYAKQRRDAIESFEKAGRDELAERERYELSVVEEYLPKPLSDDEIRRAVRDAVAASGASGPGDLGKVMREVMPRLGGQADGRRVNAIVREELS